MSELSSPSWPEGALRTRESMELHVEYPKPIRKINPIELIDTPSVVSLIINISAF